MGRESTYNDVMLRELKKNAPPTSLDSTSPDTHYKRRGRRSFYNLRLIRKLLSLADSDFSKIPISERALLESVLKGNSIADIARKEGCSQDTIRTRVSTVLDHLNHYIDTLQEPHEQLQELNDVILHLQAESVSSQHRINDLTQKTEALEREVARLNALLEEFTAQQGEDYQGMKPVDSRMKRKLRMKLSDLGFRPMIQKKLEALNLVTVYDVVIHTENQLSKLNGMSLYTVEIIKARLQCLGLQLGTDIRWVSDIDDYYVFRGR